MAGLTGGLGGGCLRDVREPAVSPSWPVLRGFFLTGAALAFGWRGDWAWAAVAAVSVLLPVIGWVRAQMAATRTALRAFAEMTAVCDAMRSGAPAVSARAPEAVLQPPARRFLRQRRGRIG